MCLQGYVRSFKAFGLWPLTVGGPFDVHIAIDTRLCMLRALLLRFSFPVLGLARARAPVALYFPDALRNTQLLSVLYTINIHRNI